LTLSNITDTVKVGATANSPTVTVGPAGSPNSPLIWKSSNENVAIVGADGKITGISEGTAVISVTAPNGLTAEFAVTVVSDAIKADDVKIGGGNPEIEIGQTYTPGLVISPADATDKPIWTSSHPGVASVNPDTGEITGISEGETVVTVTIGDKTDSITVTVKAPPEDTDDTELPVNTPDDGFTPIIVHNADIGDSYYAKINFLEYGNPDPNFNALYHTGSIHLEDIITDGNYIGVTVEALDAKYAPYITIGVCERHENKPSIIFSYEPTNDEFLQMQLNDGINGSKIPVQVKLSRGDGKTAVITINLVYNGSLVTMDASHLDV